VSWRTPPWCFFQTSSHTFITAFSKTSHCIFFLRFHLLISVHLSSQFLEALSSSPASPSSSLPACPYFSPHCRGEWTLRRHSPLIFSPSHALMVPLNSLFQIPGLEERWLLLMDVPFTDIPFSLRRSCPPPNLSGPYAPFQVFDLLLKLNYRLTELFFFYPPEN